MNLNCFYVVLICSVILISRGFIQTIVTKIENSMKGLTSEKVGVTAISEFNRGIESLKHIDIKMQLSHDIRFHAPEIISAFELLSTSLQNMKFGADRVTLHAIDSTLNLVDKIAYDFNSNFKDLNHVLDTFGTHHSEIAVGTLKEMIDENMLKFDRLMIQSLDRLEPISSNLGIKFGENAIMSFLISNKIENLITTILLCTIIFLFKTKLDPTLAILFAIVILYFIKSGYDNIEISNLNNDVRRLDENNRVVMLHLESMISDLNPNSNCNDNVDVMIEISKLKDEIVTRITAEQEETKKLEQLFEQYRADETLFQLSTFALINPRPIFPTLPSVAFDVSKA